MLKKLLLLLATALILFGCAGEDKLEVDVTPPQPAVMIPHLGDTGIPDSTVNFYTDAIERNGIDAVSDENWIQIQWEHLVDDDIEAVEIYRFCQQDYMNNNLNFLTKVDSFAYNNQDYYKDEFENIITSIDKNWFYFINAIDQAGNATKSDTVGYRLMEKPILISPSNNYEVNNLNEIIFKWRLPAAIPLSQSHLLVYDENYELIWTYTPLDPDPLDPEGTSITYTVPPTTSDLYWRVDIAGQTIEDIVIEDQIYSVESGSESVEYRIRIK